MQTGIALSLWMALLGHGPGWNQPAATQARPAPSGVVPVAYQEEADALGSLFVPPAPLPDFFEEEVPRIQFEFSRPESCFDSRGCPPAPPAELDVPESSVSEVLLQRAGSSALGGGSFVPQPEIDPEAPAPTLPSAGPQNVEQWKHLQAALEHLAAAGMPEAIPPLRRQLRESRARLRSQFERELAAKQQELERLGEEVARLKQVLVGEATLTFRVQHYRVHLSTLREIAGNSDHDAQAVAAWVLNEFATAARPDSPDAQANTRRLQQCLQWLVQERHADLLAAPMLRTVSGQEATLQNVGERIGIPVPQPDGEMREVVRETGTRLQLRADLLPDGSLRGNVTYEHAVADFSQTVTLAGKTIPGLDRRKIQTRFQLQDGETVRLGGLNSTRRTQHASGDETVTEVSEIIFITPTVMDEDDQAAAQAAQHDQCLDSESVTAHEAPVLPAPPNVIPLGALQAPSAARFTEQPKVSQSYEAPQFPYPSTSEPPSLPPVPYGDAYQLIPSPAKRGPLELIIPSQKPRKRLLPSPEPEPVLPPAPVPADDLEPADDADKVSEADRGPVI